MLSLSLYAISAVTEGDNNVDGTQRLNIENISAIVIYCSHREINLEVFKVTLYVLVAIICMLKILRMFNRVSCLTT